MNTTKGWYRAQLKLKGLEPERNSLEEIYLMNAIRKENIIDIRKTLAIIASNMDIEHEEKQKLINKYIKEADPAQEELNEDFVEQGQKMLDGFAGEVINLNEYTKVGG